MKTIAITKRSRILNDLLALAKQSDILLQTTDGAQFKLSCFTETKSFEIGESDELADEIKISRENSVFMEFLNQRGEHAKDRHRTRISEVRRSVEAST